MLALLGVINIVYGAILAMVQKDFKLVLAYSSISHMGIVLLGLAAFNVSGLQGAVFQLISHGLISALMFLLVGSIYERTETTQLDHLGGLASHTFHQRHSAGRGYGIARIARLIRLHQ